MNDSFENQEVNLQNILEHIREEMRVLEKIYALQVKKNEEWRFSLCERQAFCRLLNDLKTKFSNLGEK